MLPSKEKHLDNDVFFTSYWVFFTWLDVVKGFFFIVEDDSIRHTGQMIRQSSTPLLSVDGLLCCEAEVFFSFSLLLSFWWLSFVFTAWGWCVSHTLRAPLTRCCGFTETALKCKCHTLTFKPLKLNTVYKMQYFFWGGGSCNPLNKSIRTNL